MPQTPKKQRLLPRPAASQQARGIPSRRSLPAVCLLLPHASRLASSSSTLSGGKGAKRNVINSATDSLAEEWGRSNSVHPTRAAG